MSAHLHPLPCWTNGESPEPAGAETPDQCATTVDLPAAQAVRQVARRSNAAPRKTAAVPVALVGGTCDPEAPPQALRSYGAWAASLGMHFGLLFFLSLIALTLDRRAPENDIVSVFTPLEDPSLEIVQPEDTWNTDSAVPVMLTPAAIVEKSARNVDGSMLRPSDMGIPELPDQMKGIAPEVEPDDMTEVIPGIQGDIVTTDGDVGSVDRVTTEILGALRESKVLVVWLLDASESLRTRREQVIGRFDRVYQELGELAEHEPDALLTSVIGFGKTSTLMTKTPTADPDELRKAVRSIPADGSGIENVFAAVQTAVLEYRAQARKGYRVMLVVLTDESGSDPQIADQALALVKKHEMPVYVLGPLAPFSRSEIRIRWVDRETSEVFHLPVERGPAAAAAEYPVSLFSLFNRRPLPVLSSGFGPFGLSKLAHESGGICFVYNDGHIKGPAFDSLILRQYSPDYVSQVDYRKLVERHALRKSVMACSLALQEADFPTPQTEFLTGGIQFEIRSSFQKMEESYDALDQVVQELMSVRKHYAHEPSRRWRAHYDLLLGQVLIRRLQIESSVPLLNEMFSKPRSNQDVTCNAFELAGINDSSLLGDPTGEAAEAPPEAKPADKAEDQLSELALARLHLERAVRDHAGTPWAVMAQAELESPLAVEWREKFVEPPEGQPMPWDKPPGEWKALSKEDREKLEEARDKFERFRRFRAEQKKKKAEQIKNSATTPDGKKREPPNL